MLPLVFDNLKRERDHGETHHSIVVVVSPLVSIMADQTEVYSKRGLRCASVGKHQTNMAIRDGVRNGEYQVVYMSPESMLTVLSWREMFRSEIYFENIVGLAIDEAHCVEKWGESFRTEFAKIAEIRSLFPRSTNVMDLTATATLTTRTKVIRSLEMGACHIVSKVPNQLNIKFSVVLKPEDHHVMLMPILSNIVADNVNAPRAIVFCRTYKETILLFSEAATELGRKQCLYSRHPVPKERSKYRLCDKFDACTAENVKTNIISSFTQRDGTLRCVFATVAFAVGLDSPNVRHIHLWGPPNDVDMLLQEAGRAGRDGQPAAVTLYYNESDLNAEGVHSRMLEFCRNKTQCRREQLMQHFSDNVVEKPDKLHDCCDICARSCQCSICTGMCDLQGLQAINPIDLGFENSVPSPEAEPVRLPRKRRQLLKEKLLQFRHRLALAPSAPSASQIVGEELCTGITDTLISKIIENCNSIADVEDLVKIGVTDRNCT